MLLRVSVKVGWILSYVIPELLLLELPNIVLLVSIGIDFDAFWHLDSLLEWPASIHVVHSLLVHLNEVGTGPHGSLPQTLLKSFIFTVSVWVSFDLFLFNLIIIIFICLLNNGGIN